MIKHIKQFVSRNSVICWLDGLLFFQHGGELVVWSSKTDEIQTYELPVEYLQFIYVSNNQVFILDDLRQIISIPDCEFVASPLPSHLKQVYGVDDNYALLSAGYLKEWGLFDLKTEKQIFLIESGQCPRLEHGFLLTYSTVDEKVTRYSTDDGQVMWSVKPYLYEGERIRIGVSSFVGVHNGLLYFTVTVDTNHASEEESAIGQINPKEKYYISVLDEKSGEVIRIIGKFDKKYPNSIKNEVYSEYYGGGSLRMFPELEKIISVSGSIYSEISLVDFSVKTYSLADDFISLKKNSCSVFSRNGRLLYMLSRNYSGLQNGSFLTFDMISKKCIDRWQLPNDLPEEENFLRAFSKGSTSGSYVAIPEVNDTIHVFEVIEELGDFEDTEVTVEKKDFYSQVKNMFKSLIKTKKL